MPNTEAVSKLVSDFVGQLSDAIRAKVAAEVRARVVETIGANGHRGPGRPRTLGAFAASGPPRNAPPKQLCPVPGCKNPAAPAFGMLCAAHKNTPKAKVATYREARRKAKLAGKSKRAPGAASSKPVRKGPPSPARKLQGKYLGALRSLKGEARARVKALAHSKGVAAAVKLALSLKKAKSGPK